MGIPIRTIQDIRKKLERSGDLEMVVKRKTKSHEASRTARNANFVARVQDIIDDNPSKSTRAIARDLIYLEVMKDNQGGGREQALGLVAGLCTLPHLQEENVVAGEQRL